VSNDILDCSVTEQVASTDDHLRTLTAGFKQELKDIILCVSPFITFREPFLLSPAGLRCPSRDYFPQQVCLFTLTVFIECFSTFIFFVQ
jgi:1-phosphatidylinositol-3-phosphate 5-kinase